LVNLLTAMQTAPSFGPGDVLLALSPISFDIAALELFLPIISGGTVVIASREETRDPYLLASAITRSGCTMMQATPATWRTLLLSGWDNASQDPTVSRRTKLRALCGGEVLSRDLANRLVAAGVDLWNMYGPTETTIWSLIHNVREQENEPGPVSVGKPIANTTAHILDGQLQLLPVGIPGELFVGGVGLAKGYRNRPRHTADHFIEVPALEGERLYRTGDVAIRQADGSIKVLGRADNQVKIRGHRLELEAVEAAVLRHPRVAAAAARVWPEPTGDSRLSTYVVPSVLPAPDAIEMRQFLASDLPDFMIPRDVIALPAIPLTRHGKVDRSRLPFPTAVQAHSQRTTAKSSEEEVLVAIWEDLLDRKGIGPEDNFFDLGGHSLLAAELQQRIFKEFGRRVPLVELFGKPTFQAHADLIQQLAKSDPALPPGVVALNSGNSGPAIFWVDCPERSDLVQATDGYAFFSVSLAADDLASLAQRSTLEAIAALFADKIAATQFSGPYAVGGFCAGGVLAYEVAQQLRAIGRAASVLILFDVPNPARVPSCDSLARTLSYLSYILKRANRIGLRMTCANFSVRIRKHVQRRLKKKGASSEMTIAEICEAAALSYVPEEYTERVLLLLSADRPPHWDYESSWRSVVRGDMYALYLDARHCDSLKAENIRDIGEAIRSHLGPRDVAVSVFATIF
jgi:thioesterase domain-containing protein/aryl carrier-like protein